MRLAYFVNRGALNTLLKPAHDGVDFADRRTSAKLRALAATLALHAWRLDHPAAPLPQALDVLTPDYLTAVPVDPFGKGPLRLKFVEELRSCTALVPTAATTAANHSLSASIRRPAT